MFTSSLRFNLILLYVFSIPIVDVLSFSALVPLPLMFGLLLLLTSSKISYEKHDLFLVLAILFTFVPYAWSVQYIGYKTFFHCGALIFSVVVYFFTSKTVLRDCIADGNIGRVLKIICVSLVFSSVFIMAEYILNNFYGVSVESFIPHLARPEYGAIVLDKTYRSRGFATESGVMAIYFEMYFFILCGLFRYRDTLNVNGSWLVCAIVSSVVALTLLFSTASILVIGLGCLVILFKRGISIKWLTISVFTAMTYIIAFGDHLVTFFEDTFTKKIAFFYSFNKVGSAYDRSLIYDANLDTVINFPLGIGHGIAPEVAMGSSNYFGYHVMAGQGSLFLLFLVSGGFLSFVFFCAWLVVYFRKIAVSREMISSYILGSFVCIVAHYTLVSEYWLPFFWFAIALYSELNRIENKNYAS